MDVWVIWWFRNGNVESITFLIKIWFVRNFGLDWNSLVVQGGKRKKKGKNPNLCDCTNSANELNVKHSNVAIECSNVRVQARLGQRAEASNIQTCLVNFWSFDFSRSWAKDPRPWTFELWSGTFEHSVHLGNLWFFFTNLALYHSGKLWYCVWDFMCV